MHLIFPIAPFPALLLAAPTGVLLVRVFIVQHDCGHGSFFASRRANALVGRMCSLITMTPFANWSHQHALHHANWNNLDRTGGSDIYSACLTVEEYLALSHWQRLLYRLPRHPLIANILLPPLVFVLLYRVPFDTPRAWVRERWSVHLTNAALVCLFGTLVVMLGWKQVLLVHLSIMLVASILGVWLFSLQHRFETAHWTVRGEWSFVDAALRGSSWFNLPRPLQWLTGNIGFHHVHHLDPRVPNYRLEAAHHAVQALRPLTPLGLGKGLTAPFLTLWDERRGRLVRFRDAGASGRPLAERWVQRSWALRPGASEDRRGVVTPGAQAVCTYDAQGQFRAHRPEKARALDMARRSRSPHLTLGLNPPSVVKEPVASSQAVVASTQRAPNGCQSLFCW